MQWKSSLAKRLQYAFYLTKIWCECRWTQLSISILTAVLVEERGLWQNRINWNEIKVLCHITHFYLISNKLTKGNKLHKVKLTCFRCLRWLVHTKLNCSYGSDLLGRGISGLPIPGPYGNTMRLRHWTRKRGFYGKCVWELVANLATNEISFSFPNLSSSHHSEDQGSANGLNLVTSHIGISVNNSTTKIPLTGLLNKNITFKLSINNKHNNNNTNEHGFALALFMVRSHSAVILNFHCS